MALMLSLLLAAPAHAAKDIDITVAQLESVDEGYRLSAAYAFDLSSELREAVARGVPLYFKTEVEIIRPRWYWFDKVINNSAQTARISYNVLTRQYRVVINGNWQQHFDVLEDALSAIRKPPSWLVVEHSQLKNETNYELSLRMYLDIDQLPKPFQVNALNNSDWRMSSERRIFTFRTAGQ